MNKTEQRLNDLRSQWHGAKRVESMLTSPGLWTFPDTKEAVKREAGRAVRIIADELQEAAYEALRNHRDGSNAYLLAAEITREDPTNVRGAIHHALGTEE